jgi:hypothetical protein
LNTTHPEDIDRTIILFKDNLHYTFDVKTGTIASPDKKLEIKVTQPVNFKKYFPEKNYFPSDKTLWKIQGDILLYDDKVVYESKYFYGDIVISGFYNGIGQLLIISGDEDGIDEDFVGYIDVFGNLYFED